MDSVQQADNFKGETSDVIPADSENEAVYRYLFENNPLPMWIYDLETLRFLKANDAAVEKYGYSHAEFNAMTLQDMHPSEDIGALVENVQSRHEEFQHSGPWRHCRKDGSVLFVEVTSHAVQYQGRPARFVMAQDITERKQAEEALRASEAALKKAQRVAQLGSWTWHIPTNRLEWSDEMYNIFGIDRASFTGDLADVISRAIHPDDREAVERINHEVAEQGRPTPIAYRVVRPDGTVRTVWGEAGELVLDPQGRPTLLTGIVLDITERKQIEEQLRLQSLALESAANAIVITDRAGRIIWTNPAFETLTGYTMTEVAGQTSRVLKSGAQDSAFYAQMWDTILAGQVWHSEILNRRKDGTLYIEEQTITPMIDPSGAITHFIAIKQDVTERKEAEERLAESEERLRLALLAANQGLFDVNIQSGQAVVNDSYATMLGYDPSTLNETFGSWLERMHPDDRHLVSTVFQDYIDGRAPEYRVEFRQRTRSGGWMWILSMGRVVERDSAGRALRMLGTHTDITERKQAELEIARLLEESQRRLARISTLRIIDTAINTHYCLQNTLQVVLEQVQHQLQVDAVDILLYSEQDNTFQNAACHGLKPRWMEVGPIAYKGSLAGKAIEEGIIAQFNPAGLAWIEPRFASLLNDEKFETYYAIPLRSQGKVKGVLELFHRTVLDPDAEWLHFFETLAGQAAIAIEQAQLIEGLRKANDDLARAYDATIAGWSLAMDLRDKETEGHTLRVTQMSVELAQAMGFSGEALGHVRRGALLHDIGKMGVPDAILLKPGALTPDEWRIMKLHATYAYEMLKSIDYLRPALDIPHLHHEKWDGTGYPYGLKGTDIPLAARLFAVVDVYDALSSDRPYRPAWTKDAVLAYIRAQTGSHFDPAVVEAFLRLLGETPA